MATDSGFPIRLNGVDYNLAHDSQAEAYSQTFEPLRPQNSALAISSDSQSFNVRPDVLIWDWDDWQGGEGQFIYDRNFPNRYWRGNCIDPFWTPGTLRAGFMGEELGPSDPSSGGYYPGRTFKLFENQIGRAVHMEATTNATGASAVWQKPFSEMYDSTPATFYTAKNVAGPSDGIAWGFARASRLWTKAATTAEMRVYDYGLNTWSTLNSDTLQTGREVSAVMLNDYIYQWQPNNGIIREIPIQGTWPTTSTEVWRNYEIGGWGNNDTYFPNNSFVLNGYGYFGQNANGNFNIIQVEGKTAAASSTINIWKVIEGMTASSMWTYGGFIYFIGRHGEDISNNDSDIAPGIFYLQPDGTFGTLGQIRGLVDYVRLGQMVGSEGNADATFSYFVSNAPNSGDPTELGHEDRALWAINHVTGGYAYVGTFDSGSNWGGTDEFLGGNVLAFEDGVISSVDQYDATNGQTVSVRWILAPAEGIRKTEDGTSPDVNWCESPLQDFNLIGEKILSSLVVEFASGWQGTDWDVRLYYRLEDDIATTWTLAGTISDPDTENGNDLRHEFAISNTAASVPFYHLRLRVEFEYTGLSSRPQGCPAISKIAAVAQVARKVKSWRLRLQLHDEVGDTHLGSRSAQTMINNLRTAAAAGAVPLIDGMEAELTGQSQTYAVVIDNLNIVLSKPGEGYADVLLREVEDAL